MKMTRLKIGLLTLYVLLSLLFFSIEQVFAYTRLQGIKLSNLKLVDLNNDGKLENLSYEKNRIYVCGFIGDKIQKLTEKAVGSNISEIFLKEKNCYVVTDKKIVYCFKFHSRQYLSFTKKMDLSKVSYNYILNIVYQNDTTNIIFVKHQPNSNKANVFSMIFDSNKQEKKELLTTDGVYTMFMYDDERSVVVEGIEESVTALSFYFYQGNKLKLIKKQNISELSILSPVFSAINGKLYLSAWKGDYESGYFGIFELDFENKVLTLLMKTDHSVYCFDIKDINADGKDDIIWIEGGDVKIEYNKTAYGVTSETYVNRNIKTEYPIIIGLKDDIKQNRINEIIKSEALKIAGIYERAANKYSLEMGCIIKYQSEQLLSIQYIGVGYVQGGAYPNNLFYTTNINIKNASRIRLKDLVNIDKKLVEVFLKGRYTVWDPELNLESEGALDDVRMSFNTTSLIKYFNEADLLYQNSAYVFSYFTKGALGISIGVPHAIGDHVEFEILYRDIPDSIKTKSAIWNDL